MQIGFVGLGKMGANMVHRLRRDGDHAVVAYDPESRCTRQRRGVRRHHNRRASMS